MELFRQWQPPTCSRVVRWCGSKADEKEEDRRRGEKTTTVSQNLRQWFLNPVVSLGSSKYRFSSYIFVRRNTYESYSHGNMRDAFFIWSIDDEKSWALLKIYFLTDAWQPRSRATYWRRRKKNGRKLNECRAAKVFVSPRSWHFKDYSFGLLIHLSPDIFCIPLTFDWCFFKRLARQQFLYKTNDNKLNESPEILFQQDELFREPKRGVNNYSGPPSIKSTSYCEVQFNHF